MIERKSFKEDGESYGEKYEYTNSRKLKKTLMHVPFVWLPSDEGVPEIHRDGKGNDHLIEESLFDSSGNLIQRVAYDDDSRANPRVRSKTSYKYDHKNRKKAEYYHWAVDTFYAFREFSYYDNNFLKTERVTTKSLNPNNRYVEYHYGKDYNIDSLVYTENGKKNIITFRYKFDKYGNWVEQVKVLDGKPLYVRKRILTYY